MSRLLAGAGRGRTFKFAVISIVLLGTWLRLRGYLIDVPTLWLDEAFWAMRILTKPITQCRIRPVGFVVVTRWIVETFGTTEAAYRAIPFFTSLCALWLMPYVATKLYGRHWVALLTVFLFAIHPVAIEMSAEFKHYGVEIGIYVILLAAYLFDRRRQSGWSLTLVLGLTWFALLFSFTVIFLYPAIFLALAWHARAGRQWRRLLAITSAGLVCFAAVLTVYLLLWQGMSQKKHKKHWGYFYDVFYLEHGPKNRYDSRLAWTAAKYVDLASIAGDGREKKAGDTRSTWQSKVLDQEAVDDVLTAVGWLWFGLHLAGICCLLVRRRYDWLLLLWTPLLWVMVFNALYRWPAGAFRTNAFYIPFSLALAMFGLDWLLQRATTTRRWVMSPGVTFSLRIIGTLIAGFVVLPSLWFRPSWDPKGAEWTEVGAFRDVLNTLAKHPPAQRGRATMLLDNSSQRPWLYYLRYDDLLPRKTKLTLTRAFKTSVVWGGKQFLRRIRRIASRQKGQDFWVVTSKPPFKAKVRAELERHCTRVEVTSIEIHTIFRCVAPKRSPGLPPEQPKGKRNRRSLRLRAKGQR